MFYGMVLTMERIDKVYFRAVMRESGQTTLPDQGWLYWGQYVGESWFYYWAMVFIFGGIVGGVIVWWVGGWWYKLRLKWSGIQDPDPKSARTLYVYSSLVYNLPKVLSVIVISLLFSTYIEASSGFPTYIHTLLSVFLFWSLQASYQGIVEVYSPQSLLKVKIWFVFLPASLYVLSIGLIALIMGNGQLLLHYI